LKRQILTCLKNVLTARNRSFGPLDMPLISRSTLRALTKYYYAHAHSQKHSKIVPRNNDAFAITLLLHCLSCLHSSFFKWC